MQVAEVDIFTAQANHYPGRDGTKTKSEFNFCNSSALAYTD